MIKLFRQAFKITNENIILTTPLVLFLLLFSLYLGVSQRVPENIITAILLFVTILFMISAFFAGWFYMVKRAVELGKKEFIIDEDKAKASFNLIKEVPFGIGEYFLSFLSAAILYGAFFIALIIIGFKIGSHFIGDVGFSLVQLRDALATPMTMKGFISSLSTEQLAKLNQWNFLFMAGTTFYSFITMFWAVEIINKNKNAFVAFFSGAKFAFSHFLGAIILFIYISFINFTVSLINAFSASNTILYFISMLLYFYFVVYVVVLVFLYYDEEKFAKQKFESQGCGCDVFVANCVAGDGQCDLAPREENATVSTETPEATEAINSGDSGTDSFGQDESGDSNSEKN